jgi:predicted site-specific integrase-resolvase
MHGFVTTKEAKKTIGVTDYTLRKWADAKLFPSIRTPTGQRLYNISKYVESNKSGFGDDIETEEKKKIVYCRVSSVGQKDDLQRQVDYMQSKFPNHTCIKDIGSGINFKRKGLRTILELANKGMVSEVVVAYRDRLCRFAFELVQWFFQINGVKLVVLHEQMDSSKESELAEDLLSIINVFNCRINGKRKYNKRDAKDIKTTTEFVPKGTITNNA